MAQCQNDTFNLLHLLQKKLACLDLFPCERANARKPEQLSRIQIR